MIAVIIPTWNEEKALPQSLAQLFRQRGRYRVLVVDGGSTDQTREIAGGDPGIRLLSAPKGRAIQMNAGARAAAKFTGPDDWLLFLHADTILPDGALERLNALKADSAVQAGGFQHRFTGRDWRLRLISWLDNLRCRYSHIIYGDQALFVRRALFERVGGFPEQPILEDVALCERLLGETRPILLTPPVLTDARKFVQMGIWRSLGRVLLIIMHVQFRVPVLPRQFFRDIR
jgi:rSAM/selenodomain-associated transferase 2